MNTLPPSSNGSAFSRLSPSGQPPFAIVVSFVILALMIHHEARGQWVQNHSPYGSGINSFASLGSTVIAATNRGIYRSTNGGGQWVESKAGIIGTSGISSLAVANGFVFAGGVGGMFRSSDGGDNWASISSGLAASVVTALTTSGTTILAATNSLDGAMLYRSTDNGSSWVLSGSGLPQELITCFAANGGRLYAGTDGGGVYFSGDSGLSWSQASYNLSDPRITTLAFAKLTLFAGTRSSGVFQASTLLRLAWSPANSGLTDKSVLSLMISGSSIFAGSEHGGVYISDISSESWSPVNMGLPYKSIKALGKNGSTIFAGTSGAGIFRSTDNGTSWVEVSNGLHPARVFALKTNPVSPATLFTAASASGVFSSTDNGQTWTMKMSGLTHPDLRALAFTPSGHLFAATWGGGVFRSTDEGTSWTPVNSGLAQSNVRSLLCKDSILFAGTDLGIYTSVNEGAVWTKSGVGLVGGLIQCLAAAGPNVFASRDNAQFYRTTDNGAHWALSPPPGASVAYSLAVMIEGSDTTLFAGMNGSWRVSVSTDVGLSWSPANSGLPPRNVRALAVKGRNLFAGTEGEGVFLSTNKGISWTSVNGNLESLEIECLLVPSETSDTLFAGTFEAGVAKRSMSSLILSLETPATVVPNEFTIAQNYPNPFNPSTTIRYELPKASVVRLSVYDMLGREVSVLVNDTKDAGAHEVTFDGSNLGSGVYVYRMAADDFVQSKKLILLK